MRKVEFLEGLPALNTEIFNRLVKYLTEDLKLRFNDIFQCGILSGYPSNGNEFNITITSIDTSDSNNKKVNFKIGPGIAYVTNNDGIVSNPNNVVGDGFFERIYIDNEINLTYSFTDNNTTFYVYIKWKAIPFQDTNDKFISLKDENITLYPFLNDSYDIIINTTPISDSEYIFLGKISINSQYVGSIDYSGRKYFKIRIKDEDFHNYLVNIFKNGVITTRDKSQQNIDYSINVNKLNIKIGDGFFNVNKDLFFINGYIISNFNGLNSYVNTNGGYTITIDPISSYYLYIQQINNYGTITFSLKPLTEVVNDGIKVLKIIYSNNAITVSEVYDIFNIIDPVKTIGVNSIPLKLIKHDNLDSNDKNVIKEIFDKITSNTEDPQNFINTHHISNNAITTDKIQNGAITKDKISSGAVTDDKISPLNQRKSISYSFPRYMTQNITGNVTNGTSIKFFIGQKMRLSSIRFMFESSPSNTATFSFKLNGQNFNIFLKQNGQSFQPTNIINFTNFATSSNYMYAVIDYNGNYVNGLNIDVYKLNKDLYNNNNRSYGILFENEVFEIVSNSTFSNSFFAVELELEEYSGRKSDLSDIELYPSWRI